ncbi:hypothetical protein BDZ91DRAFT_747482 [Kalaharituber pfeilii]|nr:hypothetical protein BDZ91DRAFT_747482 [Kalaharituber pfeilii]
MVTSTRKQALVTWLRDSGCSPSRRAVGLRAHPQSTALTCLLVSSRKSIQILEFLVGALFVCLLSDKFGRVAGGALLGISV